MKQQLARPFGLVVVAVAGVPGRYVRADQPGLAFLDARVGLSQARLAGSDRLDLGSGQHDAGLERILDRVVVAGFSVLGDGLFFAQSGAP